MKKQMKHQLKLAGVALLGALALLTIDGGQMGNADAGVRIRARLKTPHVTVQYQNGPVYHQNNRRVTRPFIYRITPRDRAIARRLAWETGHRRIVLLDLRSRGLSWRQIGRRLGISGRAIRFAVNAGYDHSDRHRGSAPATCSGRGHGR
jgi:DNA-binding NarL/FixJ family response regulator